MMIEQEQLSLQSALAIERQWPLCPKLWNSHRTGERSIVRCDLDTCEAQNSPRVFYDSKFFNYLLKGFFFFGSTTEGFEFITEAINIYFMSV